MTAMFTREASEESARQLSTPGDLIVGDEEGVVCIPREQIAEGPFAKAGFSTNIAIAIFLHLVQRRYRRAPA
ncbi:hypothetical protein OKW40_004099 [Paraburkholderia sp. RAU6.4a]|uniref:hypothetical protein n=1 Tax=unclassified Paraburkholderia TaxID=2615204 RepID=UPI001613BAE3|nr:MULTISPECIES: hypothetical protein [unclassified Paraburkholderia]MBB5408197.1 hypothetical protein [Paraburkholderia sp. HC6.4b]MBB5453188.1 hypothetical protein [Paraburkholderia sp. Kb1A]